MLTLTTTAESAVMEILIFARSALRTERFVWIIYISWSSAWLKVIPLWKYLTDA